MSKTSPEILLKRIAELEAELTLLKSTDGQQQSGARTKIAEMSSEVVDSNPYRYFMLIMCNLTILNQSISRLMALKRMGIVDNYEVPIDLLNCSILIFHFFVRKYVNTRSQL